MKSWVGQRGLAFAPAGEGSWIRDAARALGGVFGLDVSEPHSSPRRKESTIIAVGHSLYFRSFFRTFLPYSVDHNAKKLKMVNAGTVAFNLSTATRNGKPLYRIEPSSISTIYGGFAK